MKPFSKISALKILVIAALILFTTAVRFSMLQKSSEPNGLDGYYYALQAKSFAQTGHLENPSHEPGYYLCGIFAKLMQDPITGCKIYSALSSALICAGVYFLLYSLTKSFIAGTMGFLLCACSPCIALISTNYINNQTGIVFFLFFTAFFARKKIMPSVIFFLLSCLSHKVTLAYSLILVALMTFQKINRKKMLIIPLSISLIFATALLAFQFPRFKSSVAMPSLLFTNKSITRQLSFGTCEMTAVCLLSWGCTIWFCIYAFLKKNFSRTKAICIFFFNTVMFFPFWNFNSGNEMGFRLYLSAMPFGIALIIFTIFTSVKFENLSDRIKIIASCTTAILLISASIFLTPKIYNPRHDPPYKYYKSVVKNIELNDDSLLIAHLGLNHTYTYYKNLRWSLNYIPDFPVKGGIWRLAYGASKTRIEEVLQVENSADITEINTEYILIKENLWQQYLEKEEKEISDSFKNWYNPHMIRPSFIRRKKLI